MQTDTPFAAELVAWRKRNHLTQTQAAKVLGTSVDVYRPWEHGRWKPFNLRAVQSAMAAAETTLDNQAALPHTAALPT